MVRVFDGLDFYRWRDTNYYVSKCGRIISYARCSYGRELKRTMVNGYEKPCLTLNGESKGYYMHRLLGELFIDNPDNKPCINHIDGNRSNNALSNLEWSTHSENTQHALKNKLMLIEGENNYLAKLNEDAVREIRSIRKKDKYYAKKFNVSKQAVFLARSGKSWKHVGD